MWNITRNQNKMILRYLWPNQPLYLTQSKTKLPFSMVQKNMTTEWTRSLVLYEIWWAPSSCIICISQWPFSEQTRKKHTPSSWHYADATLPCKQTNAHNKEHNKRLAPPRGSKLPKAPIFASLSSLFLRGLQASRGIANNTPTYIYPQTTHMHS